MTIEEKAKAYDEAIKIAKETYNTQPMYRNWLESMFPELQENEIKDMREKLIKAFGSIGKKEWGGLEVKDILAWLEKQGEKDILEDAILDGYILDGNEDGLIAETIRYKKEKQAEQNQTDKVKPKFKVGDWIINSRTGLIKHIKNVLLCDNNGNYEFESSSMSIDSVDNSFHLWTIQDAKDGDILANDNEIVIFKENDFNQKDLSGCMFVYCSLRDKKGYWYTIGGINPSNYVPATKEQRDLLFQKMHKAGYEWDARNKVMTKIEQKPANSYCQENCKGFQETGKCFADGMCNAKREAEQKPEENKGNIGGISPNWSEEDKKMLDSVIGDILNADTFIGGKETASYKIDWLQSLQDRVQPQPKQEWNEEEIEPIISDYLCGREHYGGMIGRLCHLKPKQKQTEWSENDKAFLDDILCKLEHDLILNKDEKDWLKSLRPQNRWKPSDEQIKVCKEVYADLLSAKGFDLGTVVSELNRLEEGLKKKGE